MNASTLMAVGIDVAIVVMTFSWFAARRLNNADVVEPARAIAFLAISGIFASQGQGDPLRKSLLALMLGLWSLWRGITLTNQLGKTETPTRAHMRAKFEKRPWLMFFAYYEMQAIIVGLLAAPFALVCSHQGPLGLPEQAGIVVWLVGMGGLVLRPGASKANVFCEFLVWLSYFVFALGTPWGWISVYCPLLMLFLLTQARWYAR